jgi:hypothetical protein
MTVDSQYFSQSPSVILYYRIYLSITVCHEGGASLLIRQELALMTILFAKDRKPNLITGRVTNNVMQWNKRIVVAKNDILELSLSMHREFCIVYYLDQPMNNTHINTLRTGEDNSLQL